MNSGRASPQIIYKVREAFSQSPRSDYNDDVMDSRLSSKLNFFDTSELPVLPDFSKRPKILPSNSSDNTDVGKRIAMACNSSSDNGNYQYRSESQDASTKYSSDERPSFYQSGRSQSRNASVTFFSEELNDEHTFNDIPLNEELDDFDYDELDSNIELLNDENSITSDADICIPSNAESPDPYYSSLGRNINRADSPFSPAPRIEYTTSIPEFYDTEKLRYPNKSPLDYTDEEFESMNHFEFLKDLNFSLPPLLPVYLNSNLLNDSAGKNYKTFPYQYQASTVPHVNEIYHYRINDLNTMDKYSAHKVSRPVLKRANSSNSSSSSTSMIHQRTNKSSPAGNKMINKARLLRENSNGNGSKSKLKHADKLNLIERNLIPHHVMLNHLITCNLNKDGYITSSCITRYKGKFITQIMYFSNDMG